MKKDTYLAEFLKTNTNLINVLKEGDLVSAELIEKAPRAVYFNLGSFSTGIVYGVELSNASQIVKGLKVGDKASAKVIELENENGYVELSLASADKQKAWQEIKELQDRGEILTVKIISANSGGLLAQVNKLDAFLPVSQLSADHYPRVDDGDKAKILEELQKLVGQDLQAKILDINPRAHKLILSEREIAAANVKELLAKYKVGDIVEGIVSGLADFGAFIRFADNPDIEGLIHISELDYRIIDSPKEIVKVDDVVKAKIIEIKDGRVSLSLKALQPDPWLGVGDKYKASQEVEGAVAKFNPYGAVINLVDGLQGLIHVSEFGGTEEMKKKIEPGKSYHFVIDAVKAEEKRIILKLKK
ncbi:MAG: S1 RNA-binding domain-containing protein [Patescibacteria group bacterium]